MVVMTIKRIVTTRKSRGAKVLVECILMERVEKKKNLGIVNGLYDFSHHLNRKR